MIIGPADDDDSELGQLFLAEAAHGGDPFAMSALAIIFSGAENEDSLTWLNKVIASEGLDQNTKYNIAETDLNLAAYDRAGHTRWLGERIQVLLADPRLNSEKSLEKTD